MEKPNLLYIENMSGGDKTFERKLINIIKQEFPLEIEVYFKNIKSKNNKLTAEIVHKIKHKIIIFGMKNNFKIAEAFENSLKEGSIEFQKEFEVTLKIITNYLKNL